MIKTILQEIFTSAIHSSTLSVPTKLSDCESYICSVLEDVTISCKAKNELSKNVTGRIGPNKTIFDVESNVGSFVVAKDHLGVSSQSNFSTIRANTCVYEGKWQYELMLGSKGVMQLGWTTLDGQFSQEKGVGDTPNSYAYDGNRIRKWNVATHTYGEGWLAGDVIGCSIDLDEGTASFYRNGNHLGEAFSNVRLGPGLSYFPAVSLAYSENLVANYGANPFKYPIKGYKPLQDPPLVDIARAEVCFCWLQKIVHLYPDMTSCRFDVPSSKSSLMIVAAHVFQNLTPLLATSYVVEYLLIPFLARLSISNMSFEAYEQNVNDETCGEHVITFLNLLWSLGDEIDVRACLEKLSIVLLTGYRFSSVEDSYCIQKWNLMLTIIVLKHLKTRHYLLQNVLFDKIEFPVFLYVKPPDDQCLKSTIPFVWWEDCESWNFDAEELVNDDEMTRCRKPTSESKEKYLSAISCLGETVAGLEILQVKLLLILMDDSKLDDESPSSLTLFAAKFREFLKENMTGNRMIPVHLCPLPVSLCFFHCLVKALRILWDERVHQQLLNLNAEASGSSADGYDDEFLTPFIPPNNFLNGNINYFENSRPIEGGMMGHLEVRRLGGLTSHLKKMYGKECCSSTESRQNNDSTSSFVQTDIGAILRNPPVVTTRLDTLIEIVDGIILLYHVAAHKQLGKMCSLRDSMQEYVSALAATRSKLIGCKSEAEYELVKPVLLQTREVFVNKINEQARHMAWVLAVVYSQDKRFNVNWLLTVVLRTLNTASRRGVVFSFLPDFYVDVCINSCSSLSNFFSYDANPVDTKATLAVVATFLSEHFMDSRIVSADVKDNLIQALASFVCRSTTLVALEVIPVEVRERLVRKLLQPYENRAWAQSNWILLRFWKGCGFAFRYTEPPHLRRMLGPKLRPVHTSLPNQFHGPCASELYQRHLSAALIENSDKAVAFLNSVLNQLNWAFSEFVGMLQEIQNASNSTDRVFIDSRQLKICSTCFDLAVCLLRVLEMVTSIAPYLFTERHQPSSEPLLARVCQLLCQVLNRVTSRSGCFDLVVGLEIQGLESIDHFPIITAVVGILIRLMQETELNINGPAMSALLSEPSFQISSLEFVLGMPASKPAATSQFSPAHKSHDYSGRQVFSLKNYDEVNKDEIKQVEWLIQQLWVEQSKANSVTKDTSDDDLCPICYAHPISAIFQPCGHESCRACIAHHLMNKSDCFYCKSTIDKVVLANGVILHDLKDKQTTV